jgi:glycosyltransferase involved in cell wall biosynthesis
VSETTSAQVGRILLASEHCLCDWASGAAVSATDLLGLLAQRGWTVSALTGGKMDAVQRKGASSTVMPPVGTDVRRLGGAEATLDRLSVHHLDWRGVPSRIVRPTPEGVSADVALAALPILLDRELDQARPDVLMTYGGGWCARAILRAARMRGVPTVFWLRNTLYEKADLFEGVSAAIVPSQHTARHYRETMSPPPPCTVLYPSVVRERVYCPVRQPKYLTFVSPLVEKGALFVARLVSELGRLRPDIEVLLVEGRGSFESLARSGLEVLDLGNVRTHPRTQDPREFLAVSRVMLVPSICSEAFGRGVVEAMVNGIPVVASDRGGLPEVVGTGGVVLPLPARLTPGAMLLPTVAEVSPWVEAIIRLWDDEGRYKELSRSAVASAARFDPDVLADHASQMFARVMASTPERLEAAGRSLEQTGHPDAAGATAYWSDLSTEAESLLR